MFHHFIFIELLAKELNEVMTDAEVVEIFSQEKDELILSFSLKNGNEFFMKASLSVKESLLSFPTSFRRARKNSVDLFASLVGKKVDSVISNTYDRSFVIHFPNEILLFKMHGTRSNILLFHKGKNESIFKSNLKKDLLLQDADLSRKIDAHSDLEVFTKILGKYVSELSEISPDSIQNLIKELRKGGFSITENGKPDIGFELITKKVETFSPVEACNLLSTRLNRKYFFEAEKQQLINTLKQDERKIVNYIDKVLLKIEDLENKRSYEEYANLIMANLHNIPNGSKLVELEDFYTGKIIEIKLNPELKPQKVAENYYRKAKNQHREKNHLRQNLEQKNRDLQIVRDQINSIENAENYKDLKFLKKNEKQKKVDESTPFHSVTFMGYSILVGKNAKQNDRLTFSHARKNDLWLHARDVAGSHVIIKNDTNKKIPDPVLEKAASLAAGYSKNSTNGLVSVSYTQKKYIRKPKGFAPGKVIMDREEVILVEPATIS